MKTEGRKCSLSRKVTRFSLRAGVEMKRLLVIAMLLVLGISGYTSIAKAAPEAHPARSHCVTSSYTLPYPSAGLDSNAPRLDGYAIPYPSADLDGDSHGCQMGDNPTISEAMQLRLTMLSPVTNREVVELMAFPFEGLNPHRSVADTTAASADATSANVELMAFPFEGLNPRGRVVDTTAANVDRTTANVELMAFPFEGLNPHRSVADATAASADTATANVELMAFPFEDLNPRGPVTDRPALHFPKLALFCP
jgi:hypothetical protein